MARTNLITYGVNNELLREKLRLKAKLWREHYKLNGSSVQRSEKKCYVCGETKPIDHFAKSAGSPDGRSTKCKPCAVKAKAEWRIKYPERARKQSYDQYLRNKAKPDEKRLKYSRKWYQANKALQAKRTAAWKAKNWEYWKAYCRRAVKARKLRDPNFAFSEKIRSKMRLLMRGYRKSATTETLLGCKIGYLRLRLQAMWQPGMSWENYGKYDGWVIDHIKPVDSFDLSNPEDQRACFHYTNLQPLWAKDNRDKWDKLNWTPSEDHLQHNPPTV